MNLGSAGRGVTPTKWQETFLRAPRGAFIVALTARQIGKTTVAGWAIAHAMTFYRGSLSVIACPAQRQSAEGVRRIRQVLLNAGAGGRVGLRAGEQEAHRSRLDKEAGAGARL